MRLAIMDIRGLADHALRQGVGQLEDVRPRRRPSCPRECPSSRHHDATARSSTVGSTSGVSACRRRRVSRWASLSSPRQVGVRRHFRVAALLAGCAQRAARDAFDQLLLFVPALGERGDLGLDHAALVAQHGRRFDGEPICSSRSMHRRSVAITSRRRWRSSTSAGWRAG